MIPSDQPEQCGRVVIAIVLVSALITLGGLVTLTVRALSNETPERPSSSLGAGDSGPGGPILPSPPARAAT